MPHHNIPSWIITSHSVHKRRKELWGDLHYIKAGSQARRKPRVWSESRLCVSSGASFSLSRFLDRFYSRSLRLEYFRLCEVFPKSGRGIRLAWESHRLLDPERA
ncbi:hypothetical protein NDU88_003329 [Pleurodeles waltl]|uniref:Uncharacterized protein n=1 Tax=Pleurodeles waltl TaxID=8319 RepID=A0AAV7SEE8_PLEWA|nr:hypothetical protein NDU88_003329 [Pleurodeles waltl]